MKIADLKIGQKADLEATVIEIGEVRTFVRFGRPLRVATATLEDDTGKVKMSLWNEDIDKVREGAKIKVTNGFCKEFQGEKQVTTGKLGKIEVGGSEGSKKPKKVSEEAETVEEVDEEFEEE